MPGSAPNTLSVFHPLSSQAQAIFELFWGTLIFLGAILALITVLVVWFVIRFRARPDGREAIQSFGSQRLEIVWTITPALCLIALFVLTAITMSNADPPIGNHSPDIVIVGHQWWWEADYIQSGAVTANEIHIPVNKPVLLELRSVDVIHDFWVPELGRKMDDVPGHPNRMWIKAGAVHTYLGACAEFCGTEHAWMRIQVVAQPQPEYDEWLKHQLKVPGPPVSKEAVAGAAIFQQRTCTNCHAIAGTAANQRVGPDLTHLASRTTFAAGAAENTPANLAQWLKNPNYFKPGSHMPDLRLRNDEVTALVDYLESLK
jgi:cytochrome c oxidase subunit II